MLILLWSGVVGSPSNPQARRIALVGCPRLLIQYIRSYPPYLEVVSSIRTLHAVVKSDPLNVPEKPRNYLYEVQHP
jgi:hypothetical protein